MRKIVNGSLLRKYMGQTVSLMVKPEDITGLTIKARTTDNHEVRVAMPETLGTMPLDWIEVIGIVRGADTVNAKEIIIFEKDTQDFDTESHNMLVHFFDNFELKEIMQQDRK